MSTSDHTESDTKLLRLLVPVNAREDSRWGLQYALRRNQEGLRLEVILLNVGEPIIQWEVLRFRTHHEIPQFQAARAQAFIEEASQFLNANNISSRGLFKQGKLVFTILDTAEELDCDEIVMPETKNWILTLFSRDVVTMTLHQQRGIPIVVVNNAGEILKVARVPR